VGRGIVATGLSPNQPSLKIHEYNLASEKQLSASTVFRIRFAAKHGVNTEAVPTDTDELNRFLYYDRDISVPRHRVRWNWNYDLPFGKFEVYGTKHKILDCRSTPANATSAADERCLPGYLYFNGQISERSVNSTNAAGLRTGVFGLPVDYKPAQKPITPWPKGALPCAPGSADFDTNVVYITLSNGTNQREKDTSLHPWRSQYVPGPFNWTTDGPLMKFFNVTEKFRLRMNADLFNVFNTQGLVVPAADGIASLATSYGGNGIRPGQLQLTMRLEW